MSDDLHRKVQELQRQVNYWRASAESWRSKCDIAERELAKLKGLSRREPPDPWKNV
jgi:hypothetical protein